MKLRREHAWLLTAPLAWLAGCGSGPISGLTSREPVVSLERPDPLVALRRSTAVETSGADAGAFSTAEWHQASDDPEERRLFLLSSARRRMQQQMMMQMTLPLMQQQLQVPQHQQAGTTASAPTKTSGGKPVGQTASKPASPPVSRPTPQPQPAAVEGVMPLTPADLYPVGMMGRRGRTQRPDREERSETKLSREETAATVEADRIERAAAAEAERAEKAAQTEALLAERRLLAEAEIVERMTRAQTELAERLAAAKDERDRRISMAREEHELRMQIIGVDPADLGVDPVEEALSKLGQRNSSSGESGLARFTRFFRGSSSESSTGGGRLATRPAVAASEQPASKPSESAEVPARGLLERTLDHSTGLLEDPSIAKFAATIPNPDAAPQPQEQVAAAASPTGPERLHPSLLSEPANVDDYDALLARENLATGEKSAGENWSLLNDFPLSGPTQPSAAETGSGALEFPSFAAAAPAAETAPLPDLLAEAAPAPAAQPAAADRRAPENDVWILGSERELAGFDDLSPAGSSGGAPAAKEYTSDAYTQPGGLYADAATSRPPAAAADEFPTSAPAATLPNDPWLTAQAEPAPTTSASAEPADVPVFDWSGSSPAETRSSPVATVMHQQLPATQAAVQNASWSVQSLRDACGPLPADLESLVLQLDIPEAGVRKEVLGDLARMGVKARPALPAIRVLLEDSPLVAAHAAWTLWEIERNESQAVQEFLRLMHTGDPDVVQFTAYALGSLGPKALSAAPTLRSERERFSGATRIHVAEALTRIDAFDQASVEVLIASLQHRDTHVRWMSAVALGQTQSRYADLAVPALIGTLHDPDPEVRSAAALSLGGFGTAASKAVPELQSRATLDSPEVREAAQTALACIRKL